MKLVLFFFVCVAWAGIVEFTSCPVPTRDNLLYCIEQMDADESGSINATEIDSFFANYVACLPSPNIDGATVISICDVVGGDSALTLADWNAANSCIQSYNTRLFLCGFCLKCGILSPIIVK